MLIPKKSHISIQAACCQILQTAELRQQLIPEYPGGCLTTPDLKVFPHPSCFANNSLVVLGMKMFVRRMQLLQVEVQVEKRI